ncbi:bacteriophage holin [Actinopolyspora mortivallis]|uniref:Uncharacterized protein n=1 Tax=Actinopolyspora mortivallis TaxID=33906 RepID=A0A2T0H1U8_ACTMO|nr:bacteriophage holin [Actinopolyspora mortivallis]PRW65310.1 hypothetical protein CEP50_02005 [Actinopolyspora mortivallis]
MDVPYVLMVGLVILALVLLGVSLLTTLRSVRALRAERSRAAAEVADRAGLLRARAAGVGVALRRRWPRRTCRERARTA